MRGTDLLREYGRIAIGASALAPAKGDRRFADPAWTDNPLLHRVLQAYLATAQTAETVVTDAHLDYRDDLRVRFLLDNLIDAAAPSNNPLLSPAAWKSAIDTRRHQPPAGRRQPGPGHGGRTPDTHHGRAVGLRGGPDPRRDPRRGGPAHRHVRVDPVHAPDRPGPDRAAAHRPAGDQQVLRHRPGSRPQPDRVPGVARPAGVRHLLAQPRRPPPVLGHRRLRPGHPRRPRRGAADRRRRAGPSRSPSARAGSSPRCSPPTWPRPAESTRWPPSAWRSPSSTSPGPERPAP